MAGQEHGESIDDLHNSDISLEPGEFIEDLQCSGISLEPGEFIEDLQCSSLRIIARSDGFRYGTDSVLLANAVKAKSGDRIVELCSGTGAVSILLSAKTRAARIMGIELQDSLVGMANRSAAMNGISERVGFIQGDIRDIRALAKAGSAEVVAVNPPYMKIGDGAVSPDGKAASARHEIDCGLADVVGAANWLLNPGGRLYAVYRPDRLVDLLCAMREAAIEPKELRLFSPPGRDGVASLILVVGRKQASAGLRCINSDM